MPLDRRLRMPRHARVSPDGFVQHVVNRGDHRETLFHKPGDYRAFLRIVAEVAHVVPMRILAYCVMKNHFHLLLWPHAGEDLPVFMHRLMTVQIKRYLSHYPPASPGHIYQGRYTNSLVELGRPLISVARYVEANALMAGLVDRAQEYPWSSASPLAEEPERPDLSAWPMPKPVDWLKLVNLRTPLDELKRIQRRAARGAPIGSADWTTHVVQTYGLEHTMRPPGRPAQSSSDSAVAQLVVPA